jgi:hypothetical protein
MLLSMMMIDMASLAWSCSSGGNES